MSMGSHMVGSNLQWHIILCSDAVRHNIQEFISICKWYKYPPPVKLEGIKYVLEYDHRGDPFLTIIYIVFYLLLFGLYLPYRSSWTWLVRFSYGINKTYLDLNSQNEKYVIDRKYIYINCCDLLFKLDAKKMMINFM